MKYHYAVCLLGLAFPSEAAIVFSETFSGSTVPASLITSAGTNTSATISDGSLRVTDSSGSAWSGYISTVSWSLSSSLLNDGDIIRISFDLNVSSLSNVGNTSSSVPRFSILNGAVQNSIAAGSNTGGGVFTVGFGTNVLSDGDDFTDLVLYRSQTFSTQPSAAGSAGYINQSWASGFDFGNYDAAAPATNDTGGFYRIILELTEGSSAISGSFTNRENPLQTQSFTSSTLGDALIDFSDSSNGIDGFRIGTGTTGESISSWDNLTVEVIPEPSVLLLSAVPVVCFFRRKRAGF